MAIRMVEKNAAPVEPTAFEKIESGLNEALAVVKGDDVPYATHKPTRRPNGNPKKLVTIRLDPEVIDKLKEGGEGWQSRLNATLRAALGL